MRIPMTSICLTSRSGTELVTVEAALRPVGEASGWLPAEVELVPEVSPAPG